MTFTDGSPDQFFKKSGISDKSSLLRSISFKISTSNSLSEISKSAMDKTQLILLGLPIFLLCSDLFNLFTPPPPKSQHQSPPSISETLDFPAQVKSNSFLHNISHTTCVLIVCLFSRSQLVLDMETP